MTSFSPQVMGVMHSSAEATGQGLEVLFRNWAGPVMAYPEVTGDQLTPAELGATCRQWVSSGVQIIGGCCGTTIDHMRAVVSELPDVVGPRGV